MITLFEDGLKEKMKQIIETAIGRLESIDIAELEERMYSGPHEWISPDQVSGFDREREIAFNRWERTRNDAEALPYVFDEDVDSSAAVTIACYLQNCVDKKLLLLEQKQPCPPQLSISIEKFLDVSMYLIRQLESHYVAFRLGSSRRMLTLENAATALGILRQHFEEETRRYVKVAIRDFICELYLHYVLFTPHNCPVAPALNAVEKQFLHDVQNGTPSI